MSEAKKVADMAMSSKEDNALAGTARCDAPSVQQIYEYERKRIPAVLLEEGYTYTGSENIPVSRYTSREFLALEYSHVWQKVWQMAGRVERIPNVGDYFLYEIGDLSLIIIRTAEEEISALHNFCMHRARKLTNSEQGSVKGFRCPFHGWEYEVDGSIRNVPCKWDFSHLTDEEMSLRKAKTATWGGFIFVNFDPKCVSLREYMGDFWTHFDSYPLEDTYTRTHIRKKLPCNWKAGIEAFSEGYHSIATHPQLLPYLADANSQYDNYVGEHFNRMLNPQGVSSPHLGELAEQEILDAMLGRQGSDGSRLPEGVSARSFAAEATRNAAHKITGVDHSDRSDAEMLDVIQYTVFPNFFPWGGTWIDTLIYQFKPNGDDPDTCFLEIYLLRRFDKEKPRPPASRLQILRDDQSFTEAENFSSLAFIFDQDMVNMDFVQKGMKAAKATKKAISLGNYQESRVRDLHEMIDRYLAGEFPPGAASN